jgi:NADH-quinone oxidoreductase subunit J
MRMDSALILFFILAAVAVITALGMLLSRNALYAALFLILNFSTVALLYLLMGAPFIALSQITVYAGAIMVLFLFVIMLLGAEKLPMGEKVGWQRPLAIFLGLVLLAEGGYLLLVRGTASFAAMSELPVDFASPAAVGMELFNKYLLPFEVTSVILLAAVVGAVVLTHPERTRRQLRQENIEQYRQSLPDPVGRGHSGDQAQD